MDDSAPRDNETSQVIGASAVIGDQTGRLLTTMGAGPEMVALIGFRMVLSAMAHLSATDKESATNLARYLGSEMLAAVDEFGLRGDASDGA